MILQKLMLYRIQFNYTHHILPIWRTVATLTSLRAQVSRESVKKATINYNSASAFGKQHSRVKSTRIRILTSAYNMKSSCIKKHMLQRDVVVDSTGKYLISFNLGFKISQISMIRERSYFSKTKTSGNFTNEYAFNKWKYIRWHRKYNKN